MAASKTFNDIAPEEWQQLIDGDGAISSLQNWCTHNWATSPDYAEDVARIFLPAARVMTLASDLSYAEEGDAQQFLGSEFWKAAVIDNEDYQAMLLMARKKETNQMPTMIVAFRGTEVPRQDPFKYHNFWRDMVRDFQFVPDWIHNDETTWMKYYNNNKPVLKVHSGFLSGWRDLKGKLMEQIEKFHKEQGEVVPVQLFVTGHSQGAALAGMSLLDLLDEQERQPTLFVVKGCLTVAAPKHGDQAFTDAVAEAVARQQIPYDRLANRNGNACDPVVCVPPHFGCGNSFYAAPAGRLWIVGVGHKTTGPASKQEMEEVINASFQQALWRALTSVSLHSISSNVGYLRALQE